jgi:hypothetical protein
MKPRLGPYNAGAEHNGDGASRGLILLTPRDQWEL